MYDDSGFFGRHDPHHMPTGTLLDGAGAGGGSQAPTSYLGLAAMGGSSLEERTRFTSFSIEDFSNHNLVQETTTTAGGGMGLGLHRQLEFELKHEFSSQVMLDINNYQQGFDPSTYSDPSMISVPSIYSNSRATTLHGPPEMFGEIPVDSPSPVSTVLYDPPMHMNNILPSNVFNSGATHDYGFLSSLRGVGGSLFDGVDHECYMGQSGSSFFGIKREIEGFGREEIRGNNKTERKRREKMSDKFNVLKDLIPNPTKPDRASIIGDACEYIRELHRSMDELKLLVEKKRRRRERNIKLGEGEEDRSLKGLLRSSWLQRKSKETFVDVRIIEDEVNIKLTQRKKSNCLLYVARVLQELQLELLHLAAGNIGDCHIFMINTKIDEGSSVYASAIAKKLIEVMDHIQCSA